MLHARAGVCRCGVNAHACAPPGAPSPPELRLGRGGPKHPRGPGLTLFVPGEYGGLEVGGLGDPGAGTHQRGRTLIHVGGGLGPPRGRTAAGGGPGGPGGCGFFLSFFLLFPGGFSSSGGSVRGTRTGERRGSAAVVGDPPAPLRPSSTLPPPPQWSPGLGQGRGGVKGGGRVPAGVRGPRRLGGAPTLGTGLNTQHMADPVSGGPRRPGAPPILVCQTGRGAGTPLAAQPPHHRVRPIRARLPAAAPAACQGLLVPANQLLAPPTPACRCQPIRHHLAGLPRPPIGCQPCPPPPSPSPLAPGRHRGLLQRQPIRGRRHRAGSQSGVVPWCWGPMGRPAGGHDPQPVVPQQCHGDGGGGVFGAQGCHGDTGGRAPPHHCSRQGLAMTLCLVALGNQTGQT